MRTCLPNNEETKERNLFGQLNDKVNNQDLMNQKGFHIAHERLQAIEQELTEQNSANNSNLDKEQVKKEIDDLRNFFIEEMSVNHGMTKFHDILWRFLLANYKGYSTSHKSEGPYWFNKTPDEQVLAHAYEHAWRHQDYSTKNWICFPKPVLNEGFEYDRADFQTNPKRFELNESMLQSPESYEKMYSKLDKSNAFFAPFVFEHGFSRDPIPGRQVENWQPN